MRIAIISDIHGNRTAFEAVLADLRDMAPDLILHGGDLADTGSSPVDIVDHIRDLGWRGVVGNTDEMLFNPTSLDQAATASPMLDAIREMAAATRDAVGEERLAWLRKLPEVQIQNPVVLLHASPESTWRSPMPEASDAELQQVYQRLGQSVAVYGHVHRPFIRTLPTMVVANTGSVGLSYDGDRRAAYLLVDDDQPTIRRVEYDLDRERRALADSGLPHTKWVARLLDRAVFEMPQ